MPPPRPFPQKKAWRANIPPPIATVFSVIIMSGIFTTSVPLLWSVSARFSTEKTKKFYLLTAVLAVAGCFIALVLPFQRIVNVIYGVNGYVGILLIVFMIVKSVRSLVGGSAAALETETD